MASRFSKHRRSFSIHVFIAEDSTRPDYGEERRKAIGCVSGRVVAVVFTFRGDRRRIISARRARPNERKQYDQGSSIS
ncbi:MAG: BrnT family toxin [Thermomicrobiales bacterium]|nr:BrnT family toxin [Thermomicrobiales bacterium]